VLNGNKRGKRIFSTRTGIKDTNSVKTVLITHLLSSATSFGKSIPASASSCVLSSPFYALQTHLCRPLML
jgi:hypothetical protein